MNPIRPHGLVNIHLIQLVPYNFSVHKWKVSVPKLVVLQLSRPGSPRSISFIKDWGKKKALKVSAFISALLVRWPSTRSIGPMSLHLLLLLTYLKKPFLLSDISLASSSSSWALAIHVFSLRIWTTVSVRLCWEYTDFYSTWSLEMMLDGYIMGFVVSVKTHRILWKLEGTSGCLHTQQRTNWIKLLKVVVNGLYSTCMTVTSGVQQVGCPGTSVQHLYQWPGRG